MDVFEGKNKQYRKHLTKISGNKVLRSRPPRVTMFVVSFANFKSRALSRYRSGDCVMSRAKLCVRAQASHGKILFCGLTIEARVEKCKKIPKLAMQIPSCRQ